MDRTCDCIVWWDVLPAPHNVYGMLHYLEDANLSAMRVVSGSRYFGVQRNT